MNLKEGGGQGGKLSGRAQYFYFKKFKNRYSEIEEVPARRRENI